MRSNRLQLDISGMSCASCVAHVRSALARVPDVHVDDVQIGHAVVTIAPNVGEASIRQAIADAGYALTSIRATGAESIAAQPASVAAGGCCCGGTHEHVSSAHALKRRRVSRPQG